MADFERHPNTSTVYTSEQAVGQFQLELKAARFIFFTMLFLAAASGLFATVAFTFADMEAATFLAVTGLLILFGVTIQMVVGLKLWLRLCYAACGTVVFLYVIARGGLELVGLLGCLVLIPCFVVILDWRLSSGLLALLTLFLGFVFYTDTYLQSVTPLPVLVETVFFSSFVAMSLFMLAYVYYSSNTIEQLNDINQRVNALAYKDPLTGLSNRRATEDILAKRWDEYKRSEHTFAVLLCNIDNFKEINDRYGHDFGDGVLVRLTSILLRGMRTQDIISRWAGDEFLILLPGQTQGKAHKVAERIRVRVSEVELTMLNSNVPVSVSIGVASVENALDAADIVSVADSGLFQAKHMGKNKVVSG